MRAPVPSNQAGQSTVATPLSTCRRARAVSQTSWAGSCAARHQLGAFGRRPSAAIAGQHAVRAQLEELAVTPVSLGQGGDGVGEAHRVRTCDTQYSGSVTSPEAIDRDLRRVERPVRPPPRGSHPASGPSAASGTRADPQSLGLFEPRAAAARTSSSAPLTDDQRARAVDGRDRHARGERRPRPRIGLDGDHRAARGQRLHQPGPGRDEACRRRQREHPGHVRRRDLTDRVPGQVIAAAARTTRPAGTAPPRARRWRAG